MKTTKITKPLLLLLLGFSLFSLFSCSKDDKNEPDGVVGTWRVTSLKFSATTPDGAPMTGEIINLDKIKATITFKENGGFAESTGNGYKLKMTKDGQSFTRNIDSYFGNGTWEKEKKMLIITDESGSSEFQIETLSSSTLVLKTDEVPGNDPEDEGFTNVDYTMILKR